MKGDVSMKRNNSFLYLLWLMLLCFRLPVDAQDIPHRLLRPDNPLSVIQPVRPLGHLRQLDTFLITDSLPNRFKNQQENQITHAEHLFSFFEKLCSGQRPVRIVHIGDSHVRGHVFTVAARRKLESVFGSDAVIPDSIHYRTSAKAQESGKAGLVYHAMGINGATTLHFASEERIQEIAELRPDLLILSFGTNESHNKRYNSEEHCQQIDALLTLVYRYCPQTQVLLTTPPGSYIRPRRRARKVINATTSKVADTLLGYAEERNLPIWDLYHIAGGKERACLNWRSGHYMQRDWVHYTHEGYRLHGNLLAAAFIKAFNYYVEH